MASTKSRPRACWSCHSIKIKCELGSHGGDPPCARCVRLGKECFISIPPRQKDRVATLEAQVAALTKLLEAQNIQPPAELGLNRADDESPPRPLPVDPTSKKRRLEDAAAGRDPSPPNGAVDNHHWPEIDAVMPPSVQKACHDRYVNDFAKTFTLMPVEGPYEQMRKEKPLLLQSIIHAYSFGLVTEEQEDEIARVVYDRFSPEAIAAKPPTSELVNSILLTAMWYRRPKFHSYLGIEALIALATRLCKDLGITEPPSSLSPGGMPAMDKDCAVGWRTWLLCYSMSASYMTNFRNQDYITWSEHEEVMIWMVENNTFAPMDRLFAQYVRAIRLTEQITTSMSLLKPLSPSDCLLPPVHLNNLITDFRVQIPRQFSTPLLTFYIHLATITLHERLLHTPNNTKTFGAFYTAERLSITDIPTPILTPAHVPALQTLRDSCHALIDTFARFSIPSLLALPTIFFSARIAYAEYILLKLYIACTAPGNTYGIALLSESIRIDEYQAKMLDMYERLGDIDDGWGTSRMLGATERLRDWLNGYRGMMASQHRNDGNAAAAAANLGGGSVSVTGASGMGSVSAAMGMGGGVSSGGMSMMPTAGAGGSASMSGHYGHSHGHNHGQHVQDDWDFLGVNTAGFDCGLGWLFDETSAAHGGQGIVNTSLPQLM